MIDAGLSLPDLLRPADALLDPGRRVYLPFLLGAGLIAVVTLLRGGVAPGSIPGRLFSPRLWLHRSARLDYALIAVKAALHAAALGSLGVSTLVVAALWAGWLRRHLPAPALQVSAVAAGAVFTLAAFLVEDFGRFYLHRLMHRVPLLWEFHQVHHSAQVLTPFTLYRTHPVEALLNGLRAALSIGLVAGTCAFVFGPKLPALTVLGVNAIGFVWSLLGANLRHSHVWVSYGRRLEHVLISPAQHQIHHSRDPRHHDRNFGTILALWDWLFGSLYVTGRRETLRFGLAGASAATLSDLLLTPCLRAGRLLLAAPRGLLAAPRATVSVRRALISAAVLLALPLGGGCDVKRLDRAVLLQSFATCTVGSYRGAQQAADGLASAAAAFAAAPGEDTRGAALSAWAGAIDAWQVAELLRYGPAADFETLGGKGLRQGIYAWPDVNRCLIDEQLVSRAYEGAGFAQISSSTRGLGALEYLLAYTGVDNGCGPMSVINASGSWAALTPDELLRRKAGYASAAAAGVAAQLRALIAAWEAGGFSEQLTSAGRGSTLFATQQSSLSAVAEAMSYLDTEVKDLKLGVPLGIKDCPMGTCPEALESQWADRGARHLRNNLVGLGLLLEGCPAGMSLGFDDLLEVVGAPSLATQAQADRAAALAAVEALGGEGLRRPLAQDRAAVQRVYDAMRVLTSFLKLEFAMTLQLTSRRVEGDHD